MKNKKTAHLVLVIESKSRAHMVEKQNTFFSQLHNYIKIWAQEYFSISKPIACSVNFLSFLKKLGYTHCTGEDSL
jgi:hypothetical protein